MNGICKQPSIISVAISLPYFVFSFLFISFYSVRELGFTSLFFVIIRSEDNPWLYDVWIINTLKRQVRRETDMLKDREFFVAAAVGDSLFAIGGESFDGQTYDPLATVERYDFAKKKWDYVSALPYPTMPDRCCVDTFSSSTTKRFVSGLSYDKNHDEMYGAYSYCTSYDNWTKLDVTSCQSPVLPRSLKWMWCTGTILFRKTVTSYREGGDDAVSDVAAAAWQFPSEITIPLIVATALIQPTNGSVEDKTPLISESLTNRSILLSEEESQTGSAFMSLIVVPNDAKFYPLSVISRVERTSMVAHTVPMNAMKDDMFFP